MYRRNSRTLSSPLLALLMVGICLTGCGSQSTSAHPAPQTAWQKLLGSIDADGHESTQTALQAFALAIGPVPGVQVPSGTPGEIFSGSIAVEMVMNHWAELTANQQQAIDTLLHAPFTGSDVTTIAGSSASIGALVLDARAATPVATDYQQRIEMLKSQIAAHLGRQLALPIKFSTQPSAQDIKNNPTAHAWTYLVDAAGKEDGAGKPAGCDIYLNTAKNGDVTNIDFVLAHEIFHCFEGALFTSIPSFDAKASWLIEGEANWAADQITGGSDPFVPDAWNDYLSAPTRPLFARAYDALGFYTQLQQSASAAQVWHVLDPMLTAPSNAAAYQQAVAVGGDHFLDSWAAGYAMTWATDYSGESAWGPDWNIQGAVSPDMSSLFVPPAGTNGAQKVSAPKYAVAFYRFQPDMDVLHLEISGYARLHDEGGTDSNALDDTDFCTSSKGCECPQGSNYEGPPLQRLTGRVFVAITGGSDGSSGVVAGMSLQDFCKQKVDAQTIYNRALAAPLKDMTFNLDAPNFTATVQLTTTPSRIYGFNIKYKDAAESDGPDAIFIDGSTTYAHIFGQWIAFGAFPFGSLDLRKNAQGLQQVTLVGSDAINGRYSYHLQGSNSGILIDLWVHADDYLVAKEIVHLSNGSLIGVMTAWNTGLTLTPPATG